MVLDTPVFEEPDWVNRCVECGEPADEGEDYCTFHEMLPRDVQPRGGYHWSPDRASLNQHNFFTSSVQEWRRVKSRCQTTAQREFALSQRALAVEKRQVRHQLALEKKWAQKEAKAQRQAQREAHREYLLRERLTQRRLVLEKQRARREFKEAARLERQMRAREAKQARLKLVQARQRAQRKRALAAREIRKEQAMKAWKSRQRVIEERAFTMRVNHIKKSPGVHLLLDARRTGKLELETGSHEEAASLAVFLRKRLRGSILTTAWGWSVQPSQTRVTVVQRDQMYADNGAQLERELLRKAG